MSASRVSNMASNRQPEPAPRVASRDVPGMSCSPAMADIRMDSCASSVGHERSVVTLEART